MDSNDYQNEITRLIHQEFKDFKQDFKDFKTENYLKHEEIIQGKEKAHAIILGKIDRSIEVANALASEMRGCYSAVESRQTEYEKKQAINTYQLATVVAGITFAMTFLLQYLWDILTKKSG